MEKTESVMICDICGRKSSATSVIHRGGFGWVRLRPRAKYSQIKWVKDRKVVEFDICNTCLAEVEKMTRQLSYEMKMKRAREEE